MDQRPHAAASPAPAGVREWSHDCERCGERMEERHCKIVCPNCGLSRDCGDP